MARMLLHPFLDIFQSLVFSLVLYIGHKYLDVLCDSPSSCQDFLQFNLFV